MAASSASIALDCIDILQEIILHAHRRNPWIDIHFTDDTKRNADPWSWCPPPATRFALVCRYWKQVVDATPALWSYLNCSFAYRQPKAWIVIDRILAKSKNYPLHIRLFRPHSAWRSLLAADLTQWQASFPRWTSVTIHINRDDIPPSSPSPLLPSSCPSVKEVTIDYDTPSELPFQLPSFSAVQVLFIRTANNSAFKLSNIHSPFTSLTDLVIYGETVYDAYRESLQLITLPQVKTFRVHTTMLGLKTLLSTMSCPALKMLSYSWAGHCANQRMTTTSFPEIFEAFIRRSGCQVKQLKLRDLPLECLLQCLSCLDTLEYLELFSKFTAWDIFSANRLLAGLTLPAQNDPSPPIIPHLRYFDFSFNPPTAAGTHVVPSGNRLDIDVIAKMFQSRYVGSGETSTLEWATVTTSYKCTKEEVARAQSLLRDSGLKASLSTLPMSGYRRHGGIGGRTELIIHSRDSTVPSKASYLGPPLPLPGFAPFGITFISTHL